MRSFDWSASPLGPVEQWPQSLKTTVRIMLTSRQPMFVWWGEQLINLYNDAYIAIAGGKHPDALGQPASYVWREIWEQVGPRAESAMLKNEGAYDEAMMLIMERNGYPEETYYTFSYSPVPNDQGGAGGVICANTDETERIIGERQSALLKELAARTADARTFDEACTLSASCLETNPYDLPFAMIYLVDQDERRVFLAGTSGIARGHAAAPETVALDIESVWRFDEVMKTNTARLIPDLGASFGSLPMGAWPRPPHQAVAVPIAASGRTGKGGIMVAGLNPFRLFDSNYRRFLDLISARIAAGITNAQADITERKHAEEELKKREAQLRDAQHLAQLGSWEWDIATGTVTWSDELYRIWGVDPQEFDATYEAVFRLVHPDDREFAEAIIEKANREQGSYTFEHRIVRPDGTTRVLQSRGAVVLDEAGNIVKMLGTGQDITERKRMEEALREQERFIHQIAELTPVVINVFDLVTERDTYISTDIVNLVGYTAEEIARMDDPISPFWHPDDIPIARENLARSKWAADGEVNEFEYRVRHRNGEWRWLATRSMPFRRNEQGEVRQIVTATLDVTERKRVEEELQRAREELERRVIERTSQVAAINAELRSEIAERERAENKLRRSEAFLAEGQRLTATGTWAWYVSTGELFWSREQFRIFGFDPEGPPPSITGALELIHPDDRPFVQQTLENAMNETSDDEWDCRIVSRDGTIKHVHTTAHPVFNDAGNLAEYVGTTRDVTVSKLAEEKLRESERRFRLLVEAIPHHVWNFRPDGTLGYWNQRLVDYTGLTAEELRQGGWAALHPGDVERVRAAWREAFSRGTAYAVEQRVRGRDGRYRRFMCSAVPIRDERGEAVEWFGTNTDVEERRQFEEALHEAQAELAHVTRLTTLGELTASIAHEVNQPLGAIVTNGNACQRLLSRKSPDLVETRAAIEAMISDAMRASEVIKRIRALVRKAIPEKAPLDVNETIQEVIALAAGELGKNRISVRTELAADLPPVWGDRVQLQQVVLNLILNANAAMSEEGWQPRELMIISQESKPDEATVALRDTGTGLDPRTADLIFDSFFTTKEGGLGLGLPISRTIIEAHGGKLWATANEDKGATFRFTLPTSGAR
jgi:PAS domain S-box-containing protein